MSRIATLAAVGLSIAAIAASSRADETAITQISNLVATSDCARHDWKDRGRPAVAYPKGMAIMFAKALCQPARPDVVVVSAAIDKTAPKAERKDALVWYEPEYAALSMTNETSGRETLRHVYALLMGLGMRESSGEHCVGRDASADFTTGDTAEAGLFQTSWGSRVAHPEMVALYQAYSQSADKCLLDVFSKGVSCKKWDAQNWGDGEGVAWQQLTKSCPAFATEYAAVLLRTSGGRKGEFGPIRTKKTELLATCDAMFLKVEELIDSKPALCDQLK